MCNQYIGKRLTVNRDKFDWETLNTPKIKTVFYSKLGTENDYGTRIRIKCHQRIERKAKTIEGELCTNWAQIDSFGVRLDFDGSVHHTDGYEKFYDDLRDNTSWDLGTGFAPHKEWFAKYTTVNHRSLYG